MIWGVEGGGCQNLGDMSSIASSCRIDDSIQQLIQQKFYIELYMCEQGKAEVLF